MLTQPVRFLAALALALTLAPGLATRQGSPIGAPPAPSGQSTGSGLILGRAVEGPSETPVADALVSLRGSAEPYLKLATLTDADGNFVLFGVPAGSYNIDANKDGYWSGNLGQRRANGRGRPLVLADGQHMAEVRVPVWKLAAVSGTVVDDIGEPVVGLAVQAMARYATGGRAVFSNASSSTARTDDRGMYRIFGLIPGEFVVALPASDAYPSIFYPGGETAVEGSSLVLGSGEERRGIDLQLRMTRMHRVSGRLVGTGAGGITVRLVRADERFSQDIAVTEAVTGADGSFTLSGVSAGSYALRVFDMSGGPGGGGSFAAAGGASSAGAVNVPASDADGQWALTPVTVGDADVTDVSVPLRASLRIDGRIVFNGTAPRPAGSEMPRMFMLASQPSGRSITRAGGRNVDVDTTGRFTTAGLPAGRYFVRLAPSRVPAGWALESMTLDGRDAMDEPVTLDDHDVSGLVITLTDKISELTGVVRTAAGAADLDAAVLVFPANPATWIDFGADPPRMRYVRVSVDGAYAVKGLPPGDYLAVAVKDEDTDRWQMQPILERLSRSATKFTLTIGGKQALDLRTSQIR